MKRNEPVSKVMSGLLTTIQAGEPVSKARKILDASGVHHVPVIDGDRLVGMISSHDMLRISFGEYGNQDGKNLDSVLDHTYTLSDVMSKNPVTIPNNSTVRDAARILGSHDFHSLPVVDGEKLVGLVTSTDLLNYLADL